MQNDLITEAYDGEIKGEKRMTVRSDRWQGIECVGK